LSLGTLSSAVCRITIEESLAFRRSEEYSVCAGCERRVPPHKSRRDGTQTANSSHGVRIRAGAHVVQSRTYSPGCVHDLGTVSDAPEAVWSGARRHKTPPYRTERPGHQPTATSWASMALRMMKSPDGGSAGSPENKLTARSNEPTRRDGRRAASVRGLKAPRPSAWVAARSSPQPDRHRNGRALRPGQAHFQGLLRDLVDLTGPPRRRTAAEFACHRPRPVGESDALHSTHCVRSQPRGHKSALLRATEPSGRSRRSPNRAAQTQRGVLQLWLGGASLVPACQVPGYAVQRVTVSLHFS